MSRVIRVTMFKIPSKESQAKLLDLYTTLSATNSRDGKPYILSLHAGQAEEDARSQGFTVVSKSEFKDMGDVKYYDEDCEAHKVLKAGVKNLGVEAITTVIFTPKVVQGTGM